jgi:hypothetical protein
VPAGWIDVMDIDSWPLPARDRAPARTPDSAAAD